MTPLNKTSVALTEDLWAEDSKGHARRAHQDNPGEAEALRLESPSEAPHGVGEVLRALNGHAQPAARPAAHGASHTRAALWPRRAHAAASPSWEATISR